MYIHNVKIHYANACPLLPVHHPVFKAAIPYYPSLALFFCEFSYTYSIAPYLKPSVPYLTDLRVNPLNKGQP